MRVSVMPLLIAAAVLACAPACDMPQMPWQQKPATTNPAAAPAKPGTPPPSAAKPATGSQGQAPASPAPAPAAAPKPGAPAASAPAAAAKPGAAAAPPAAAQANPAAPAPSQATPAPASQAPAPDTYAYRADGRRDPFVNLLGSGGDSKVISRRGEGAAGLTVGEISVSGVMQSRGSLVAMIQGPDKKTYIVHQGDKLLDGTIKTVTPQGLVVVQEVNDPLSLIKQREVRKLLRSLEDAKE
jgi:Tfp pilus assembly protein PilP